MRYLIVLGMLLGSTAAYADSNEVGFFFTEDRECSIENRNRQCLQDEGVFEGDLISLPLAMRPDDLPIRWISRFARLEPVVPGKYKVVYRPPAKKSVLVSLALDMLGFTRDRSRRWTAIAATRGAPYQQRCQRPAEAATLLPGQPVNFSWCGRGAQRLLIKDDAGKIVFARPVRSLSSTLLNPDELPLQSGVTYTWDVIGSRSSKKTELTMLAPESAAVVRAAFLELDEREDLEVNEKVIGKASFVQFMTEAYPKEVGLNWLSHQLLEELDEDALPEETRGMVRYLKRRTGIRPCGS
jgi:hypothetical protein